MNTEQIRQALERELGEGWTTTTEYLPKVVLWEFNEAEQGAWSERFPFTNVSLRLPEDEDDGWSIDIELNGDHAHIAAAAIGRALQSAAGEGPLIPLADAVLVVTDAIDNERKDWADKTLPSAGASIALMNVANAAIAALRALGGGDV